MSDKIWIVKIGPEIFGPFNQAEIIAQINNKELLETDQIASCFSRFEFIKNCEEFNLLFKVSEYSEHTRTEHTSGTSASETNVVSQTDPSVTGFFDVAVKKSQKISRPFYQKLPVEVAPKKQDSTAQKAVPSESIEAADPSEQPILIKKIPKYLQTKYLASFLVTVIIGVFGIYQYTREFKEQALEKQKLLNFQLEQGIRYKKSGGDDGYFDAKKEFRNILKQEPNHPQAFFELIETLILEESFPKANGEITKIEDKKKSPRMRNEQYKIHNYKGLIYLYLHQNNPEDLSSEAIQEFEKALKHDKFFVPAIMNLGTAYFLNGEYKDAKKQYDLIEKKIKNGEINKNYPEFEEGIFKIHRISNAIQIYLKNNNGGNNSLKKEIGPLEKYKNRTYDFKLELSVLLALLHLRSYESSPGKDNTKAELQGILDLDLDLTDLHFHNPQYYYLNEYFWKHVLDNFKDKGFEWNSDPRLQAIREFLIYKTLGKEDEEKKKDVAKKIQDIFDRDKSRYKIRTLLAYIQHKLGQKSKSHRNLQSIFTRESKRNNPLFKFQYATSVMMDKGELKNAEEHLKDIQSSDQFKLQALSYLAVVSEKMGKFSDAKEYFNNAQKFSKNYKPLLELQARHPQWATE